MTSVVVTENDGYFCLQGMHSNSSDREQIESYISSSIKNTFSRVSVNVKFLDARPKMAYHFLFMPILRIEQIPFPMCTIGRIILWRVY